MNDEDVYMANERLVAFTMNKDFPQYIGDEDAMQEGRIGLWRAVLSFDPDKGYSFSSLAVRSIHNYISMYLRYLKKPSSPETVSLYEPLASNGSAKEIIERIPYYDDPDWHIDFDSFLKTLDENHRNIVAMRTKGYTDQEIADKFGVTRQAILQNRQKIHKMYKQFQKEGVVH